MGNGGNPLVSADHAKVGRDLNITVFVGDAKTVPPTPRTLPPSSNELSTSVLLVLVHGTFGDTQRTWRQLEEGLESVGQSVGSVAVYRYGYPSQPWQEGNLAQAAEQLRDILIRDFPCFEHYMFICHSAGGLVVKHMLSTPPADPGMWRGLQVLQQLTRLIVNVAVPHRGVTRAVSRLSRAAYFVWRSFAHIFEKRPGVADKYTGTNRIFDQVQPDCLWILDLERRFGAMLDMLDTDGSPRPMIKEISGARDWISPPPAQPGARRINASHTSINAPQGILHWFGSRFRARSVQAPALTELDRLARFANSPEAFSAVHTFLYCKSINSQLHIGSLLGDASAVTSQAGLVEQLSQEILANKSSRIVVVGPAGVGKSTSLRHVASRVARQILSNGPPSPMLIASDLAAMTFDRQSIQRLTGADKTVARRTLAKHWAKWASNIAAQNMEELSQFLPTAAKNRSEALNVDRLATLLQLNSTVIILDSVDEFASRYRLPPKAMRRFLNALAEPSPTYKGSPCIVLGVRDTLPDLGVLCSNGARVFRLESLAKLAPQDEQALAGLEGDLRNLAMTPLFLRHLADWAREAREDVPRATRHHDEQAIYCTRAGVALRAIRSLLYTRASTHADMLGIEGDDLIDVLSAIAMCFYDTGFRTDAAVFRKAETLANLRQQLLQLADRCRAQGGSLLPDNVQTILNSAEALEFLVRNSVFIVSGQALQCRFTHELWQTFLLSYYIARSLECGAIGELGRVFFVPESVYMASTLLFRDRGWEDQTQARARLFLIVDAMLQQAVTNSISVANGMAVICGNEAGVLPTWLIDAVLNKIRQFHTLAIMVSMNAIAHIGVLRAGIEGQPIRDRIAPWLADLQTAAGVPWFLRSIAAHYLHMFGQAVAIPGRTDITDIETVESILLAGKPLEDAEWTSLLWALYGLALTINLRKSPRSRVIACVHFCYALGCLKHSGREFPQDLVTELRDLVAPTSSYSQTITKAGQVDPELLSLYDHARTLMD